MQPAPTIGVLRSPAGSCCRPGPALVGCSQRAPAATRPPPSMRDLAPCPPPHQATGPRPGTPGARSHRDRKVSAKIRFRDHGPRVPQRPPRHARAPLLVRDEGIGRAHVHVPGRGDEMRTHCVAMTMPLRRRRCVPPPSWCRPACSARRIRSTWPWSWWTARSSTTSLADGPAGRDHRRIWRATSADDMTWST